MYQKELLEEVIPFWLKYSIDTVHGGFYTCIDETGKVYDSDKFMWLQGRQVWMFSNMYNRVDKKEEWLQVAIKGAEFMEKFGRN